MEEKVLKIKIPEGYEIDEERSTFEKIVFKPKKESYKDVYKKLFYEKKTYYFDRCGKIEDTTVYENNYLDPNNCTSEKQAQKLLAINKLMNVAKYLNGDWRPDWNDDNELKYIISLDNRNNKKINITWNILVNKCPVYFKTEELAQKAINILGEETIKLALSTDW